MNSQQSSGAQVVNHYNFIENLLHPHLSRLDERLLESVQTGSPLVTKTAQYLLKAGGKRIRPITMFLFSGLGGKIPPKAIEVACCVELCHTATLIHDDIIDDAHVRRGLEAMNVRLGNQVAVLAGDYLYAMASSLIAYHGGIVFTQLLVDAVSQMVQGEIMEIEKGYEFYTTEAEYLDIIRMKTAELISMSCRMGLMMNNCSEEEIQAAAEYGMKLGLAFQIIDDSLDYTSTIIEFGKPIQQDVQDGKTTLPLIHLREQLNESDKKRLEHILLNTPSTDDLKWVADSLQEQGSLAYAKKFAHRLIEEAKAKLEIFPASDYKEGLSLLGDYVIDRVY